MSHSLNFVKDGARVHISILIETGLKLQHTFCELRCISYSVVSSANPVDISGSYATMLPPVETPKYMLSECS